MRVASRFCIRSAQALVLIAAIAPCAQAVVILPPDDTWEYTFVDPTGDPTWNTITGGGWLTGDAPFSNVTTGDFAFNTEWPADPDRDDDLWVRQTLDLTGYSLPSIAWDLGVDNGYKLYLNGALVASANEEGFTFRWEYSGDFSAVTVNPGLNVIAVALEDHGGLTAFDMQVTGDRAAAPEPGSLALIGLGLATLGFGRRRSI